jgi:Ca2+-binding RTX toxin-like protein
VIYGDAGNDQIYGGAGNDQIYGGAGADVIDGGPGSDVIAGGNGPDIMLGSAASAYSAATAGGDLFVFTSMADGGDSIYGFDLDFATGNDGIDLRPLFDSLGYGGTTPRSDGYLYVFQNGANTDIYVDANGSSNGVQLTHMVTLDHVSAASLTDSYFLF